MSRQRPFVTIDDDRIRNHEAELRGQINDLKLQIEEKLERRASVSHLRHLILEREQHLRRLLSRANLRRTMMSERVHPN